MGCDYSIIKGAQVVPSPLQHAQAQPHRKKAKENKLLPKLLINDIPQNVRKIALEKTPNDIQLIEKAISKHFLLFKLSKQERKQLANAMQAYQTDAEYYVFTQGMPASLFFIIHQGQVQIQIQGKFVKIIKKGDFFGELALIYSAPRTASVKALKKCTFWCLSQYIFLQIQRNMVKNNFKIAKPFVTKLPMFSYLSIKQKDSISYSMNTLKYQQEQCIFKYGQDALSFYIIIDGCVEITIQGKNPIKYKKGDAFGQNCIKQGQKRSGTAKCLQITQLLAISRQNLRSCLGQKAELGILFYNIVKWSIRRSQIFKQITVLEESKLISLGQLYLFKNDEIIIKQRQKDNKIYISLQGKINDFQIGQIINEEKILKIKGQSFESDKTLVKKGDGYVFSISIKLIEKQRMKQKQINTIQKVPQKQIKKQTIQIPNIQITKIELKDLYFLTKLGQGQMGRVYLVQHKKTSKRYALKCIQKNIVIQNEMQKFVLAEKQVLKTCNNPFIVHLIQCYKDNHFIYLLLDYIEGGDFFDLLQEVGLCTSQTARFYFGCLLFGIEYLHKKSIIYRDLKPENAAIDSNGYLHIIDLGTAKMISDDQDIGIRTFTIIGTPHYMAPQIMQAKGYSFPVDIWSLGVILYQMVCGILPFGSNVQDPIKIYQQAQKNQIVFPKQYTDAAGKSLISRLLEKHPQKRHVQDFKQIKNMEFFKHFNWDLLQNHKIKAPVLPKLNDFSNSKSQFLLSYLQKQKQKLDKPIAGPNPKWDESFC